MNANRSSAHIELSEDPLPSGSFVNINTKEGANALLNGVSNFDYFSSALKEIRKLRKKKQLSARNEERLEELYGFFYCVAGKADRKTFREKIPESEVQCWLDYTIDEIKSFTNKQSLNNPGFLEDRIIRVLQCCFPMFARHVVPVSLAFKSEFFQVLANFVKGFRRTLTHALFCDSIGRIAFHTLTTSSLHNSWSMDKIFKKFEASGFLEQILRCYTVPDPMESRGIQIPLDIVLEELESCIHILARKFKSGEPCGDTLKAILDGRDGSPNIQPHVVNRLNVIARLAEAMDSTEFEARLVSGRCSYCSTNHDVALSACARCQFVFYCSKECQKADWNTHKCDCRKLTTAELDRAFSLRMNTLRFMNQNSEAVFKEMDRWSATGMDASDLAVQINFIPNGSDNIIPSFDGPATRFRIAPIQHLISKYFPRLFGDTPTDLQRSWREDLIRNMQEAQRKSTSGILVVNHAGRIYIDTETIKQYRQAVSCPGDMRMKLGTIWCSNRVTAFHNHPTLCTIDSELVIDSSFELL